MSDSLGNAAVLQLSPILPCGPRTPLVPMTSQELPCEVGILYKN